MISYLDENGKARTVSEANPLPVSSAPGGAPVTATLDDILAELQAQTVLLIEIRDNTAA